MMKIDPIKSFSEIFKKSISQNRINKGFAELKKPIKIRF